MFALLLATAAGAEAPAPPESAQPFADRVEDYLESYFDFYPIAATAAGRHDHDHRLPDFSPERIERWRVTNQRLAEELEALLAGAALSVDNRLDAELLARQARRELFGIESVHRFRSSPLLWSGTAANATTLLLVRERRPLDERVGNAIRRTEALPEFLARAGESLRAGAATERAAELFSMAAGQARAAAIFYRDGLGALAESLGPEVHARAVRAGQLAGQSLEGFAETLATLGETAQGSPRLGPHYAPLFRLVTGERRSVDEVFRSAESDLAALRREASAYGRGIWPRIFPGEACPVADREVLRRLFARVGEDRAASSAEFVEEYRRLVREAIEFAREKRVFPMPEGLSVVVDASPAYFLGQSVGGVYPAGPFAPDEATLLFVPTPPDDAPPESLAAFYRDFNHHFNVMILPHEVIPGHALQLAVAARSERKARALFADGVYVEGWGTFSERLMLDLGWGDELARVAHYKKQLENVTRTLVDIGVHTRGWSRDEVLRWVREEGLQDEQFAANMWRRAITSSPQLTTYHLGFRAFHDLYQQELERAGASFELATFLSRILEMGPVPVRRVAAHLAATESEQDSP